MTTIRPACVPVFLFAILFAPCVFPDVLVLKDGQKIIGEVTDKGDAYEVKSSHGVLTINKDDVHKIVKNPDQILAEADKQRKIAKGMYEDAIRIKDDPRERNRKLTAAVTLLEKVLSAYNEAREIFTGPEYAHLDKAPIEVIREMRLCRERMVSEKAATPAAPANSDPPAAAILAPPKAPSAGAADAPPPSPAATPRAVPLLGKTFKAMDINTSVAGRTVPAGVDGLDLHGSGTDIWLMSDGFHYAFRPIRGDFDIQARIESVERTAPWAKAGLMIRQDTTSSSIHASMFVSARGIFAFQHREQKSGRSLSAHTAPVSDSTRWVRLVRTGSTIRGYRATDAAGKDWTLTGSADVSFSDPVLIGLAVCSRDETKSCCARIRNIRLLTAAKALAAAPDRPRPPTPRHAPVAPTGDSRVARTFKGMDINTGVPGRTIPVGADGFDIEGSGVDIWARNDGFRFVCRPMQGDFDIQARVESVDRTHFWAKAGVMIRQDNAPSSIHASLFASAGDQFAFQWRENRGDLTHNSATKPSSASHRWVRLVRAGTSIRGYHATDAAGKDWTLIGSTSISFSGPVLVGLCVCSHDDTVLCRAKIRDIRLLTAGGDLLAARARPAPPASPAGIRRPSPVSNAGLVAHWPLDDKMGTKAADASGQGHVGELHGNPTWTTGRIGGALSCDGMDDYVDTGFGTHLATWTIACWVRSPSAPAAAPPSGPVQMEQNLQITWNHGNSPAFRGAAGLRASGAWHSASFGPLEADRWYHLAATYDGDTLRAYTDGALVTENTTPSGAPMASPKTLKLGRHAIRPCFFQGTIDDVRIYNRALAAGEIGKLSRTLEIAKVGTPEPAPSASSSSKPGSDRPSPAERMLDEARKAVERKRYTEVRTIARRIIEQYPDSLEAFEARAILEEIPHPDGRLVCGFDSAGEIGAWRVEKFYRHPVTWKLNAEKMAVREGEGSVQLGLTRDPDYTTGAAILELDDFDPKRFRGLSFWVFQVQPSGGRLEVAFIRPNQKRLVWVDRYFGGSEMGACLYYATPLNFRGWKQFKIPAAAFKARGASGVRGKITWYDAGALVFYDASRKGIDCFIDSLRFIETTKK